MKQLQVPFLPGLNPSSPIADISAALDKLLKHKIDNAPWAKFNYVPDAAFTIAHGNNCVFLKYYVSEAVIKGACYQPNGPVYKDSCVEFFVAFDDDKQYYNFEFNVIGNCMINFGINRYERKIMAEKLISTIKYLSTIQNKIDDQVRNPVHWELCLMIPIETFSEHHIVQLAGRVGTVNFYKCGDELPVPHFLCWNNINTPHPDFHVPECFGKILFL